MLDCSAELAVLPDTKNLTDIVKTSLAGKSHGQGGPNINMILETSGDPYVAVSNTFLRAFYCLAERQ